MVLINTAAAQALDNYLIWIQAGSALAMAIATIVLIIITGKYAKSSRDMAKVAENQFKASQRPFLHLKYIGAEVPLTRKQLKIQIGYSNLVSIPTELYRCDFKINDEQPKKNVRTAILLLSEGDVFEFSYDYFDKQHIQVEVTIFYKSIFDPTYYYTRKVFTYFISNQKQIEDNNYTGVAEKIDISKDFKVLWGNDLPVTSASNFLDAEVL